jgi:hypothetical protein
VPHNLLWQILWHFYVIKFVLKFVDNLQRIPQVFFVKFTHVHMENSLSAVQSLWQNCSLRFVAYLSIIDVRLRWDMIWKLDESLARINHVLGTLWIRFFAYFRYFEKVEVGLCDLHAVCVSPFMNFWMAEPVITKLGMYIMAPLPIPTACFINPSHQSLCLYVYPVIVSRQRLGKRRYRGNEYT